MFVLIPKQEYRTRSHWQYGYQSDVHRSENWPLRMAVALDQFRTCFTVYHCMKYCRQPYTARFDIEKIWDDTHRHSINAEDEKSQQRCADIIPAVFIAKKGKTAPKRKRLLFYSIILPSSCTWSKTRLYGMSIFVLLYINSLLYVKTYWSLLTNFSLRIIINVSAITAVSRILPRTTFGSANSLYYGEERF